MTHKFSLRIFEEGNNKFKTLKIMHIIELLPKVISAKFVEIKSNFPSTASEIKKEISNFESNLEEGNFIKKQNKVMEFATGKIDFYHKSTIGFQGSWNG